jgi:hypothetical protein
MTDAESDRAVAPVVGKALEAGLVVLFVGLLTSALYGHAVPEYRSTAGDAVADRALSEASHRVQQAVPPNATRVDATLRVGLPDTVRGRTYEVRAENRSLVLDHPHPAVSGRQRLALPDSVGTVRGSWHSAEPAVVHVTSANGSLVVELEAGDG